MHVLNGTSGYNLSLTLTKLTLSFWPNLYNMDYGVTFVYHLLVTKITQNFICTPMQKKNQL